MVSLQPSHRQQFQTHGYTILHNALTGDQLNALYEEADTLINHTISEGYDISSELGCIIEPLTCGFLDPPESDRYKTDGHAYQQRRDQILESSLISQLTQGTIAAWAASLLEVGEGAVYLMNEQYIVKPPQTAYESQFAWHQDSDYLHASLRSEHTVACWTALDDVNEANGTLLLADLTHPENKPTPVCASAGAIVFMSNRLPHKSTGNATARFRRVFMPQYSRVPLMADDKAVGLAVPCDLLGS